MTRLRAYLIANNVILAAATAASITARRHTGSIWWGIGVGVGVLLVGTATLAVLLIVHAARKE